MKKMTPLSPSNVEKFRACPRSYMGQYVTKEIKFVENAAMRRGSRIHKCLELSLKGTEDTAGWLPEDQAVREFCRPFIQLIHRAMNSGWDVHVELEAAVDTQGQAVGWWDDCYLRSKIDVLMLSPEGKAIAIDWKTGKTPGKITQFQLNTLSVNPMFNIVDLTGQFIYVDERRAEKFPIHLPFTNLYAVGEPHWQSTDFAPLVATARAIAQAWRSNSWPATPNRGCRWCDMPCEHKG